VRAVEAISRFDCLRAISEQHRGYHKHVQLRGLTSWTPIRVNREIAKIIVLWLFGAYMRRYVDVRCHGGSGKLGSALWSEIDFDPRGVVLTTMSMQAVLLYVGQPSGCGCDGPSFALSRKQLTVAQPVRFVLSLYLHGSMCAIRRASQLS